MDDLLGGLKQWGMGPLATWLEDRVDDAVKALDLEPADLTLMKPVLTDSANVVAHAGVSGLSDVQERLRSITVGTTDPAALLQAMGYGAVEAIQESTFTIAEIPLPGGGSFPLTVRVRDLLGGGKT